MQKVASYNKYHQQTSREDVPQMDRGITTDLRAVFLLAYTGKLAQNKETEK